MTSEARLYVSLSLCVCVCVAYHGYIGEVAVGRVVWQLEGLSLVLEVAQ